MYFQWSVPQMYYTDGSNYKEVGSSRLTYEIGEFRNEAYSEYTSQTPYYLQKIKLGNPNPNCENLSISLKSTNGQATIPCGSKIDLISEVKGGTSSFSYEWFQNDNTIAGVNTNGLTISTASTYKVKVTDSKGCSVISNSITLTSNAPSTTISGNTSICTNENTVLTANVTGGVAPYSYSWKQGSSEIGTGATLNANKISTYNLEVKDKNGCTTYTSIEIKESTIPVSITGTNSFCVGQNTTLTASVTGGVSPYTYQRKQNAVNVGTNATTYAASVAGSYSVGVTDSKGCTGTSAAYSVTQKPSPNVTVSTSRAPTLLTGESVVLSVPTASGQTYQWAKDGAVIAGATNNSYTVSGAGSYTVTVTGGGCTATSSAMMVSIILANEPLVEEVGLRVSPNPTVNQAKIVLQLAQSASVNLHVLDASGKRIRTWESAGKATHHEATFDMRSVAAGSYVVQAEVEGQVFTEKLVKQ